MYLARREAGKSLRVYQLKSASAPIGWAFNPGVDGLKRLNTNPPICEPGCAATGFTRSEAIGNLQLTEEALQHA